MSPVILYIFFFFSHLFMFSVCCLLHDRDTPHQNSRRCFDSSVCDLCVSDMCVSDMYVSDLYVSDLCVSDLYVSDLCVSDFCV